MGILGIFKKEDSRTMTCDRCRKAVSLDNIKYLPRGGSKAALCSECRAKGDIKDWAKSTAEKKAEDYKDPFFCERCRYKFKFDSAGVTNLKCPYCGKSDQVKSL